MKGFCGLMAWGSTMKESGNPLFDFILFGGSGDLALRKLLPALYHIYRANPFQPGTRVVCVGRSLTRREVFLERVEAKLPRST